MQRLMSVPPSESAPEFARILRGGVFRAGLFFRTQHDEERASMTLSINDLAPDFEAVTTDGKIRFHDWIGDSWAVLFSHPKHFTPVCTTELGRLAFINPEFDRRGVKIIALSVDPVEQHDS
jgi:hypothetical protein